MKRWLRKHTPSQHALMQSRWLRPLGKALEQPGVWLLNRRSAAMGVALGLAAGLLPGPAQILAAAALSLKFRANLPTAVLTTLYTNPITIIPLYILAYHLGAVVTGDTTPVPPLPEFSFLHSGEFMNKTGQWVLGLGDTLVIGLLLQAVIFAASGYFLMNALWRWSVSRRWAARRSR